MCLEFLLNPDRRLQGSGRKPVGGPEDCQDPIQQGHEPILLGKGKGVEFEFVSLRFAADECFRFRDFRPMQVINITN